MNEHYTHFHLYVEKYDRYEQFLLLDFVDVDEFAYFSRRLDFPIQSIKDEKTMLFFEHIYFREVHPKEGKIYEIPLKSLISLRWVKPADDEPSSSVVAFRVNYNSEQNPMLSEMFNRPVSEKRFIHKVSDTSNWNGAPCGAEKLSSNIRVKVKKVGQGSWNEIYSDDKCNIVFDIGSSILDSAKNCRALLAESSAIGDSPTLIISHWDIDHYSLLKYVSDEEILRLCCAFVPSECISLTSKNIARRLENNCKYLRSIKPFTTRLVKRKTSLQTIYSGSHYVLMFGETSSNINLSGFALVVWNHSGCAYLCADHSYYQVFENLKKAYEEKAKSLIAKLALLGDKQKVDIIVPHHGGDGGKIESGYKINHPGQAVVSTGRNNYGHPRTDVREHLCKMGFIWSRLDHSQGDIVLKL